MTKSESANCAVLFADITGSTRLFTEVGDAQARRLVASCLDKWTTIVGDHQGQVVQLRGDGLLLTFPDPEAAVRAATSIRDRQIGEPLGMHAGVHVGSIMQDGEQLYGDVVNIAARVADIAKKGEILVTDETMQQLSRDVQDTARLLKKVPIKKKEPMNLYLIAENDPVTEYLPPVTTRLVKSKLQLRYQDQDQWVNDEKPEFIIGRVDDCDLIVDHSLVSRHHATIECKRGKFFLQDQSTNGTYVRDDGSASDVVVQRDLVQLKGKGVISLGMDTTNGPEHCIEFEELNQSG